MAADWTPPPLDQPARYVHEDTTSRPSIPDREEPRVRQTPSLLELIAAELELLSTSSTQVHTLTRVIFRQAALSGALLLSNFRTSIPSRYPSCGSLNSWCRTSGRSRRSDSASPPPWRSSQRRHARRRAGDCGGAAGSAGGREFEAPAGELAPSFWEERILRLLYVRAESTATGDYMKRLQLAANWRNYAESATTERSREAAVSTSQTPQSHLSPTPAARGSQPRGAPVQGAATKRWPLIPLSPLFEDQNPPSGSPRPVVSGKSREQNYGLLYLRPPLLSQLPPDYEASVLGYNPPRHESIPLRVLRPNVAHEQNTETPRPVPRRRMQNTDRTGAQDEVEVAFHPLERFPIATYMKLGLLLLLMGFPVGILLPLMTIAGLHMSGSLDPFLTWMHYITRRLMRSHWLLTDRQPVDRAMQELAAAQAAARRLRDWWRAPHVVGAPAAVTPPRSPDINPAEDSAASANAAPSPFPDPDSSIGPTGASIDHQPRETPETGREPPEGPAQRLSNDSAPRIEEALAGGARIDDDLLLSLRERSLDTFLQAVRERGRGSLSLFAERTRDSPGGTRAAIWLEKHRVCLYLLQGADYLVRAFYQLVVMFIFTLNPRWQPLRMLLTDDYLLPVLAEVRLRSVLRRIRELQATQSQQQQQPRIPSDTQAERGREHVTPAREALHIE